MLEQGITPSDRAFRVGSKLTSPAGRYLLYAIGEIALIVIGILIALYINNWNETLLNGEAELKALQDLKSELVSNKSRIEEKQRLRKLLSPSAKQYINSLSQGEVSYENFRISHRNAYMFGITNPTVGVIESLISSGEIALLTNDSLKYLIADWRDQLGNLKENEMILWEAGLAYNNSFSDVILDPKQDWSDWDKLEHEKAFKELVTNVNYRNKLIYLHRSNEVTINNCDVILNILDEILSLIEVEIRKTL